MKKNISMTRIAMITTDRSSGGIREMVVLYADLLLRCGYRVELFIPAKSDRKDRFRKLLSEEDRFCINEFSEWSGFFMKMGIRHGKIRKIGLFDGIIIHNPRLIAPIRFLFRKIRIIAVNHSNKRKSHRLFRKADWVVALTVAQRKQLAQAGIDGRRIFLIPNATGLVRHDGEAIGKGHQAALTGRPIVGAPIVGSMGRMVPKKGFAILIEALEGLDAKCVLAGDGPERHNLEKLAEKLKVEVEFLNWVDDKEPFFAGIDIFCLPSTNEPFGLALIEAMARGIPVVASDTEGPLDIVSHGENGLLFEGGNAGSLARMLEKLVQDKELRGELAERGGRLVQEKYGEEVLQENLRTLLEVVMEVGTVS